MTKKSTSTTKSVPAKGKSTTATKQGGKKSMKSRILIAIASQHALGKEYVDKQTVLNLSTVTNKHTFDTTCAAMKKQGLIEYDNKGMKLTEKGLEEVGPDAAAPPQNNDAAQEMLKDTLKGRPKKTFEMFDVLTDGRAYSRADIAEKVNMDENAKTFKTYISYLSKIVEKEGDKIKLKDTAFPWGRPCDKK